MNPVEINQEALREALLNVQRLREKEQLARGQMETLIQGLQILSDSESVADMYREILATLGRLIPFDAAAILVQNTEGSLVTAICSDDRLRFASFPVTGIFERCLQGKATVVTSPGKILEWPLAADGEDTWLRSALLAELPGLPRPTLLLCASEQKAGLKRNDMKLLQTFSPLATQAVRRASEMEQLNLMINKLDYYAHRDTLTGLPNRAFFDVSLEHELDKAGAEFSVLFLDLDNFKQVNDTYGHAAGDQLLVELAFRLSGVLTERDTVARMGGDEFAIILRGNADIASIYTICDAMIQRLAQPIYIRKFRVDPGVSIGIAVCRDKGQSATGLMQNADIALYVAKNSGRSCYRLFSLEMKKTLVRRNRIKTELKTVVADGGLWLAYQPIVDTITAECHCLEVLLRWGADRTIVYRTDEIVPLAEATGDICSIGLWVMETALTELADWLSADGRRTVAINISDVQLHQLAFYRDVVDLTSRLGIATAQVELELSERIVAADINEIVVENLSQLESCGFGFSYDDFGTGQSSFLHLQELPGSRLKIDKTFVDDIVHSAKRRQLLAGIIDFAHALELEVVAEGVESREQYDVLKAIQCDYVQGYFFARPLPVDRCLWALNYTIDSVMESR